MIKRPAGEEAARLVADLTGTDGGSAEAAAARLVVLGTRAVRHVLHALAGPLPDAGTARLVLLLAHLPASRDTLGALGHALSDPREPVVAAALDAWGTLLGAADDGLAAEALDRLTAVALDEMRPGDHRAHAIRLLTAALPGDELRPLRARLAGDPAAEVRDAAARAEPAAADDPFSEEADAEAVRRFVAASGDTAPLPALHRLVVRAREREGAGPRDAAQWRAVRAALHQTLAQRGSTVALYDLREWVSGSASPIPVAALSALGMIGDASCLDAIVSAYDRIDDAWTREQLGRTFAGIAARAGVGRRHAIVRRLAAVGHPIVTSLPSPKAGRPRRG
jgi:hypothetical protein